MRKNNFFLIAILILSAFLRFKTLPALMIFTPDEAYQAYITQTLIKDFHVIWIGLSAGAYNLFLGPLWQYIIYPFLYFSKGDPISLGYAASILGVAATFLVYLVGKEMFNLKTGLIASLLYAVSSLLVYYDQKPYPSGITFLSLLLIYSLYKTRESSKWWILFSISFAFIFHTHLSLLPVLFVALYISIKNRKNITLKNLLISLFIFFTLISPLIVFDYFHKGSNISAPLTVLKTDKTKLVKLDLTYRPKSFFDSLGRLIYLKPFTTNSDELLFPCTLVTSTRTIPPVVISFSVLFILIYFLTRKSTWQNYASRLLALLALSFAVPFVVFQFINPVEYYLLGFFPLVLLIIASIVATLKQNLKLLAYLALISVVSLNIYTVITAKGDYGLTAKKLLISKVLNTVGTASYDLSQEGDCHKYEAWRYLFSVYGKNPSHTSEDPVFGWLYKDEIAATPGEFLIILKETRSQKSVPQNFTYSFQEGGFSAYIYHTQ